MTAGPATTAAPESPAARSADRRDAPLFAEQAIRLRLHRRRFHTRLGEFRRRRVLVPYGEKGAALTVETHGARWLLAFTDEAALGRYARARGEVDRTWRYRAVWGAAVLDAGVPAVAGTGLPCGVLVDAGDGERGLVLPPVVGIVPETVAVDGAGSDDGAAGEGGTRTRVAPGAEAGGPTGEGEQ
ncbi:SseB family protein [Streptomyces sp. NPDC020362]|uniref:SseB family protein n=1 Tax=unclassified Streptomyces TaxID=2593676 RepID=UPI0033D7D2D3